ncbi:acyl-CoA dehydrogenase family protein [Nocardioides sp. SOB77]|uniref:Acyl-CoA dehydrogenase family protein n=1 Tax=Nocardioides oceani TaxID=3058369 RepID=A0ABT8FC31_9ACTN|nr:acyl-CoA dehydrogenase family protein [Nocardioides oceani]MDN4172151.1 acyl-CoA dehydrogenase family protein [Nocardioides oceani]
MDFTLDEDSLAVQGLAREILTDRATTARVREVETSDTRVDEELWAALTSAGLTGLLVPDEHGGAGLGLEALAVLLEEQGRTVAPVPVWPTAVATLALARADAAGGAHGPLLTGIASGSARVTVALEEYGAADPAAPSTSASEVGGRWLLTGVKAAVPSPVGAGHVLVSAATPDGPGLFLVAAHAEGVRWETMPVTTHDLAGELTLDGAEGQPVGSGAALAETLRDARIALAALQLGVAQGALALAASYLAEREQFGRPLGSFQAVQHQLADCWIDIDALRVTLAQAVSDAEADSPSAAASALVVSWWRAQAGLDVVHRVQHVHGGIGVDVDYPVHRFFLWGKQLSGTLGGAAATLADLGDVVVRDGVAS